MRVQGGHTYCESFLEKFKDVMVKKFTGTERKAIKMALLHFVQSLGCSDEKRELCLLARDNEQKNILSVMLNIPKGDILADQCKIASGTLQAFHAFEKTLYPSTESSDESQVNAPPSALARVMARLPFFSANNQAERPAQAPAIAQTKVINPH